MFVAFLYSLSIYCSTCSDIKCTLETSADDYLLTSNGAVYDAIQAASTDNGLFSRFMPTKYRHFACFRLSTYLYVLFMCLYVPAYN